MRKEKSASFSLLGWEKQCKLSKEEESFTREFGLSLTAREPTNYPSYASKPDKPGQIRSKKRYKESLGELLEREARKPKRFNENAEHYEWQQRMIREKHELEALVNRIKGLQIVLREMDGKHRDVQSRSEAIRTECSNLLSEQKRLQQDSDSLATDLKYFLDLAPIEGRLQSVDVLSSEFSKVLSRVDECINFLEEHSEYKEAPQYLESYRSIRRKSLASIKSTFKLHLENVETSTGGDPLSEVARIEYRSAAKTIRRVLEVLEMKMDISKEYRSMLLACQRLYLNQRLEVLKASVNGKLKLLQSGKVQNLLRASCNLLMSTCVGEYKLYKEFFTVDLSERGTGGLDDDGQSIGHSLAELSYAMYSFMRPWIIHEDSMDVLCDLVMIMDQEILPQVQIQGKLLQEFGELINKIKADTQERLQYRTQIYIRDEISKYVPTLEDLAYYDLLVRLSKESWDDALEVAKKLSQDQKQIKTMAYRDWSPVLERTLSCLSQVYRTLETEVFEYIAYESVLTCINVLTTVAKQIAREQGSVHGHLFLIKHLLILREQISPFEVDFSILETTLDFSNFDLISPSVYGIVNSIKRTFPTLIENELDSKKALEVKLKEACESFITTQTNIHIGSLLRLIEGKPLLNRVKTPNLSRKLDENENESGEGGSSGGSQSQAGGTDKLVEDIKAVVEKLCQHLVNSTQSLVKLMALYLQNPITQRILFRPIVNNMKSTISKLQNTIAEKQLDLQPESESLDKLINEINLNWTD